MDDESLVSSSYQNYGISKFESELRVSEATLTITWVMASITLQVVCPIYRSDALTMTALLIGAVSKGGLAPGNQHLCKVLLDLILNEAFLGNGGGGQGQTFWRMQGAVFPHP